jgi:hypothetical protein
MARLSYRARKRLPNREFALKGRRYPIPDKAHARNALARVSQYGTEAEKREVRAKVHRKYPDIGKRNLGKGKRRNPKCCTKRPVARKRV